MEQDDSSRAKPDRDWDEEERWHYEQEEAARLAEEERIAHERDAAIEHMVDWFFENFEDPQNEMPYDREDGIFLYPYGGPFDAADMLSNFSDDYPNEEWIRAAVEKIEKSGTFEWAPTSHGQYYEHPEPNVDEADLSVSSASDKADAIRILLAQVDRLELRLDEITPTYGHNRPPDEVGVPPYDNDDRDKLRELVSVVRSELLKVTPDTSALQTEAQKAASLGEKVIKYAAKTADGAAQESVKTLAKYGTLLGITYFAGFDLTKFGNELINLASNIASLITMFLIP